MMTLMKVRYHNPFGKNNNSNNENEMEKTQLHTKDNTSNRIFSPFTSAKPNSLEVNTLMEN